MLLGHFSLKTDRLTVRMLPICITKTAVLALKIHVFAPFLHEKSKRMLKVLLLQCILFNIRYMLIFQIEKIFCPDFLLFHANILTTV